MAAYHVYLEDLKYSNLDYGVNVWHAKRDAEEHHTHSCVESENVRHGHQLAALAAELVEYGLWNLLAVSLFEKRLHLVEVSDLSLLPSGISGIEEEVYLVKPFVSVPWQRAHLVGHLDRSVQFGSVSSETIIHVYIAVIVAYGALTCVAAESSPRAEQPYPRSPLLVGKGNNVGLYAQAEKDIDREEPYVSAKPVEYASDEGTLVGHSCQLSVGTVVPVCPDEQQHTYEVHAQVILIEEPSTGSAYDYACQGDHYGVYPHLSKKACPEIHWSACHIELKGSLCLLTFECGAYFVYQFHSSSYGWFVLAAPRVFLAVMKQFGQGVAACSIIA